jgi:hypothetical protein
MDEQDDSEQREQRTKDAGQQPELTHSQDEQTPSAGAAGGRETRFFVTVNVCSHMAPRGGSEVIGHPRRALVPRACTLLDYSGRPEDTQQQRLAGQTWVRRGSGLCQGGVRRSYGPEATRTSPG